MLLKLGWRWRWRTEKQERAEPGGIHPPNFYSLNVNLTKLPLDYMTGPMTRYKFYSVDKRQNDNFDDHSSMPMM